MLGREHVNLKRSSMELAHTSIPFETLRHACVMLTFVSSK